MSMPIRYRGRQIFIDADHHEARVNGTARRTYTGGETITSGAGDLGSRDQDRPPGHGPVMANPTMEALDPEDCLRPDGPGPAFGAGRGGHRDRVRGRQDR
ncbi:hypothetical protein [Nonomuraea sp. NPDC003709]|uniref:hypothetical protein n=1 Tax=Nonomuraea sp. NPDC003709 TaxID=3154450 RepID=UPI0033BC1C27